MSLLTAPVPLLFMMDPEIERRFERLEQGFARMDAFQRGVEISEALREGRAEERAVAMERWMKSIDAALLEHKDNNKWLLRIAVTLVLAAVANFVLGGGLLGAIK